jgi:hypothetical protein
MGCATVQCPQLIIAVDNPRGHNAMEVISIAGNIIELVDLVDFPATKLMTPPPAILGSQLFVFSYDAPR